MKKVIGLLVLLAVIGLAYVTTKVILTPLEFEDVMTQKNEILQKQLKTIANAELEFEKRYRRYATIDELKAFLENGKVYHINAEGEYTDDMREKGISEQEAARKGLIKRDTIWENAKNILLEKDQSIEQLFAIFDTGKEIKIDTASKIQVVGQDSIRIPLVQATVLFEDYLSGIDENSLRNKIDREKEKANGFPGLRIGSLIDAKLNGNWE